MQYNYIKIIAGKYRGRKIPIPASSNIRPSPSRVRETLFNWLSTNIINARCLDLFTGSGALSIEALSRQAGYVYINDIDNNNIKLISSTLNKLDPDLNFSTSSPIELSNKNALTLLKKNPSSYNFKPFDIIFLDPPFKKNYLIECLKLILQNNWLNSQGCIYFECEKSLNIEALLKDHQLNNTLSIKKLKTAGEVNYGLLGVI